jgi:phosphoglycolate phosphatase-like HAD superfamily hydrolase
MNPSVIFDLDQTLVDTSILEPLRKQGRWRDVYTLIPKLSAFLNVDTFLNILIEKKILVVLITTSPSTYCNKILTAFKWKITGSICYHDVYPHIKPDPKAFTKAIEDFDLDIKKTISAGDRDIDIIASNAANIPAIACTWASPNKIALLNSKPNWVANSPDEMIQHIKKFHDI